jgi:hypothetical protein
MVLDGNKRADTTMKMKKLKKRRSIAALVELVDAEARDAGLSLLAPMR